MTERDYLLVTALQRLRAARDLAADARPHPVLPGLGSGWMRTLEGLDRMIAALESELQAAMEADAEEATP